MSEFIYEKLMEAYFRARASKRNSSSQLNFEVDLESHIFLLHQQVIRKTYQPSIAKAFVINKPVFREVFAPDFRDRIIHHFIYLYLYPQMEKKLINDTYSCRNKKGTHYGVRRASYFLKRVTNHYTDSAYVLKLDITGYFMNIKHDILLDNTMRILELEKLNITTLEKDILKYLIKIVIFHDPTVNYRLQGSPSNWKHIPNNKSLFGTAKGCGLPIGNLTSQLFGNIYLNDLDHYIKKDLNIKYYGRYVDDLVLMDRSKHKLISVITDISIQLNALGLQLHPSKIYLEHYTKGFYFLGQYVKPYCMYIGNRTKQKLFELSLWLKRKYSGKYSITDTIIKETLSKVNSYLGILSHANTYSLVLNFKSECPILLFNYFDFVFKKARHILKLKREFKHMIKYSSFTYL